MEQEHVTLYSREMTQDEFCWSSAGAPLLALRTLRHRLLFPLQFMPQVHCYSSLDNSVIRLRFFGAYFISPKYVLYEKINSKKLDPLTSATRPVVQGRAFSPRPEGGEMSHRAAVQGALEQNSHKALGVLKFILESKGE